MSAFRRSFQFKEDCSIYFLMMKFFVIFVSYIVVTTASLLHWNAFKLNHGKSYRTNVEEQQRFQVFLQNLKDIEEHNKRFEQGLESYEKGLNQFADLTVKEFEAYLKLSGEKPVDGDIEEYQPLLGAVYADSVDWREKGAVTPVKNQKQCGSCWSFSATGALEGQNKIVHGKLISLSEQNLVDCSTKYRNKGCNGGRMDSAFNYVRDNGINSEAGYPYTGKDEDCKFSIHDVQLKCKRFLTIERESENSLKATVHDMGPVSVAIHASKNFHFYKSGIFNDTTCSPDSINHGVLVVGYTDDYWIIKNSWGKLWGESGYIKFKRGSNMCGVASDASVPIL